MRWKVGRFSEMKANSNYEIMAVSSRSQLRERCSALISLAGTTVEKGVLGWKLGRFSEMRASSEHKIMAVNSKSKLREYCSANVTQ